MAWECFKMAFSCFGICFGKNESSTEESKALGKIDSEKNTLNQEPKQSSLAEPPTEETEVLECENTCLPPNECENTCLPVLSQPSIGESKALEKIDDENICLNQEPEIPSVVEPPTEETEVLECENTCLPVLSQPSIGESEALEKIDDENICLNQETEIPSVVEEIFNEIHTSDQESKTLESYKSVQENESQTLDVAVHEEEEYTPIFVSAPMERFEGFQFIGEGVFGKVYKSQLKNQNVDVAIKILPFSRNEKSRNIILEEIRLQHKCKHRNIVMVVDSLIKPISGPGFDNLWIIMEFCGGGPLCDLIFTHYKINGHFFSEPWIRYVSKEVLQGLSYLHNLSIAHRDIKADNIVLTEDAQVKIADFGLAEVDEDKHKTTGDIWNFGITVAEMAEGEPPFKRIALRERSGDEDTAMLQPASWSKEFNQFVNLCLVKCKRKRGTAENLLQHKFIMDQPPDCSAKMDLAEFIEMKKILEENKALERDYMLNEDNDEDFYSD